MQFAIDKYPTALTQKGCASMVDIYSHYTNIKSQHYFQRYQKFINHFVSLKQKPIKGKGAWHHILLKAMFPEFRLKSVARWNQVWLTDEQHYIAHHILWKAINDIQAAQAFWLSSHDKKLIESFQLKNIRY